MRRRDASRCYHRRNASASNRALCLALAGSTGSSSLQSLSQLSRGSSDDHSAPLPKIGDVVDRMVERAKRQDEEGVELGYESRITTTIDTLNDDGEVTKTERTLHKRYRVEDQTVRGAHRVKRASAHRERTKGRARPTREVCARGEEESRRGRCAARDERRTSGPSRVGPHHQVPSLARRGRHDRRRAVLGRRLQTA